MKGRLWEFGNRTRRREIRSRERGDGLGLDGEKIIGERRNESQEQKESNTEKQNNKRKQEEETEQRNKLGWGRKES